MAVIVCISDIWKHHQMSTMTAIITSPSQDMTVDITMTPADVHRRMRSLLGTRSRNLKLNMNCHIVNRSASRGNDRLRALLGMKIVLKNTTMKPRIRVG